jgi:hypothetical protein
MMKRARIAADLASCLTEAGWKNSTVPVIRASNPIELQAEASHSPAVDLSEPVRFVGPAGTARKEDQEDGVGRKRRRDSAPGTEEG